MKSLLGHGFVPDRQFGVSPQDGFVIHAEASGSMSPDLPVYSRLDIINGSSSAYQSQKPRTAHCEHLTTGFPKLWIRLNFT